MSSDDDDSVGPGALSLLESALDAGDELLSPQPVMPKRATDDTTIINKNFTHGRLASD
jgi:hypothetical protein